LIERGQLWWVDLGEPRGSAPGFRRPMLVVSADPYNRSRIATVICASVTTNLRLGEAPGNVILDRGTGGLPKASVVNVSQIVTLNKEDLLDQIGVLGSPEMSLVDVGLRQVLAL
jgi:mRNA interferase MazF